MIYIALICFAIAIWAATGIGCTANQIMMDNCEIRAVSTAMSFRACDIPHRLAVDIGYHVAVQVWKNGQWKFLDRKDEKYFQPIEYMSLQKYLEYLVVRYNAIDSIGAE